MGGGESENFVKLVAKPYLYRMETPIYVPPGKNYKDRTDMGRIFVQKKKPKTVYHSIFYDFCP